jgi:hypothetical protein
MESPDGSENAEDKDNPEHVLINLIRTCSRGGGTGRKGVSGRSSPRGDDVDGLCSGMNVPLGGGVNREALSMAKFYVDTLCALAGQSR